MKIKIEISKRIFLFYVMLNAIGYNQKIRPIYIIRKKIRNFLKKLSKKNDFGHTQKILNYQNLNKEFWFPFRTWILCHKQPPNFKEINSIWKKYLDEKTSYEFKAECLYFWEKLNIKSFWNEIYKEYLKIHNKCLAETKFGVKLAISYLRLSNKNININQFIVIPNFLDEYHRGLGPLIDKTAYAILGPSPDKNNQFPSQRIMHEFLHAIINPLTKKIFNAEITNKELSIIREYLIHAIVLRSNKTDKKYYNKKIKLLKKQYFKNIKKIILILEKYEAQKENFNDFLLRDKDSIKKACLC